MSKARPCLHELFNLESRVDLPSDKKITLSLPESWVGPLLQRFDNKYHWESQSYLPPLRHYVISSILILTIFCIKKHPLKREAIDIQIFVESPTFLDLLYGRHDVGAGVLLVPLPLEALGRHIARDTFQLASVASVARKRESFIAKRHNM